MDTTNLPDLRPTYGALFIGLLFATFFQGILTVQVYHYYDNFPDDLRRTKVLVAVLWILDFAHFVLIAYSLYYYLVLGWGNRDVLSFFILPLDCHLLLLGISGLLSQLFFLNRIWVFSQRNLFIVTPLLLACLAAFCLIIGMTARLFEASASKNVGSFQSGVTALFVVGAATDIVIAGFVCYYLRKRSKETCETKATNALVSQVIRYTVATSLLTSLIALAGLITLFAVPNSFVTIAIHFSSGRTYTNAVLVNLNARRRFRETLMRGGSSCGKTLEFAMSSSVIPPLGRSRFGQIESIHFSDNEAMLSRPEMLTIHPAKAYTSRTRFSMP